VVTIGLDLTHWPGRLAGQHLDARLTAEDGYTAEREYSIASAPGEPVAITVERLVPLRSILRHPPPRSG
jgi:ferredoxin-NADP reductase